MNTLIGVCNNISQNIEKIKIWSKSFKHYCPEDQVVLYCANATQDEVETIQKIGIIPYTVQVDSPGHINHKRLAFTRDFFEKDTVSNLFLATDVYDVVFQNNPFLKHDTINYDLFFTEEGVQVHEEPWNFQNIKCLFPKEFDNCLYHNIVCSGVICGKRDALINLYNIMIDYCENKSTDMHNIKDQAALMVILSNNLVNRYKKYTLNDAWVVNCAVAGPTQFFEGWGFKNKLISKQLHIPYLDIDNFVKTNNLKYDIVHQFNRVPVWNDAIAKIWLK